MQELSAEMTAKFAFPNVNDRLEFGFVELPNRPRRTSRPGHRASAMLPQA
jgi:hypothetical protein